MLIWHTPATVYWSRARDRSGQARHGVGSAVHQPVEFSARADLPKPERPSSVSRKYKNDGAINRVYTSRLGLRAAAAGSSPNKARCIAGVSKTSGARPRSGAVRRAMWSRVAMSPPDRTMPSTMRGPAGRPPRFGLLRRTGRIDRPGLRKEPISSVTRAGANNPRADGEILHSPSVREHGLQGPVGRHPLDGHDATSTSLRAASDGSACYRGGLYGEICLSLDQLRASQPEGSEDWSVEPAPATTRNPSQPQRYDGSHRHAAAANGATRHDLLDMTDDQLSAVERIVLKGLRRADPAAAAALASLDQSAQRRVLSQFNESTIADEPGNTAPSHAAKDPQPMSRSGPDNHVPDDPAVSDASTRESAGQRHEPPTQPEPAETPAIQQAGDDSATRKRRKPRWAIAASALVAVAAITAIAYTVYNNDTSASPSSDSGRISAGTLHSCGVRTDGAIQCWGDNTDGLGNYTGRVDAPSGTFTAVSVGDLHSCGLSTDGTITCWGNNNDWDDNHTGQADAPSGTFTAVSAGYLHSCGIRTDGTITCWGNNNDWDGNHTGQADAPSGTFTAVSAGAYHSCGIRTDGTITCWGSNNDWDGNHTGQADAPSGTFTAVSAGDLHSCGLSTDGTITCWGGNNDWDGNHIGQADSPSGTFTAVSAGYLHSCGIRTDGTITCWGGNNDWDGKYTGQADAPSGAFTGVGRRVSFVRYSHRRHNHMLGRQQRLGRQIHWPSRRAIGSVRGDIELGCADKH